MKKVIVAEDDGHLRPWIAEIVEEMGYCCLQASNGSRALHLLEDNPDVALLITDAMMPELNGEELVRILHCREQTRDMPIIFISAVRRHEDIRRLASSGVTNFMSKPIEPTNLRKTVLHCLSAQKELAYSHA